MGRNWIAAALMLVALGGCDGGDGKGASVSIKTDDDKGSTTTSTSTSTTSGDPKATVAVTTDDTTGNVKIDAKGFKLDVDVPKSLIDSADFDIDGVKLYPGSKVRSMQVKTGEGDPRVHIAFISPADPQTVRGYLVGRFADKGRKISGTGMTIEGTTEEGKPFTIALAPAAGGQTSGDIAVTGKGSWSGN